MKEYSSKKELVETIQEKYQKYISEFATIPENLKEKRVEDVDKTPSENLSYQLGWINLLLQWEKDEQQGKNVKTPEKGYKWNNLGGLYQSFYNQYGSFSLKEQEILLTKSIMELCEWINSLSDKELFEPERRKWATTKAKWPLWKWIHINTVAPFTNFRIKIRKWKKLTL